MPGRGRPRGFDIDEALDAAIDLFWRHGYEGTTLEDLTTSMGISRPSLYAAFGDKQRTFERALRRYAKVDMAYVDDALAEHDAFAVAERFLTSNVRAITDPAKPPGCLSIQGAIAVSSHDEEIVDFVVASRAAAELRFTDRFRRAIEEGDLPDDADPAELAKYLFVISSGMSIQAAAGTPRETLERSARRALAGFPSDRRVER